MENICAHTLGIGCTTLFLMIFKRVLKGHSIRNIAERFQHSYSTISIAVHQVSSSILKNEGILFHTHKETSVVHDLEVTNFDAIFIYELAGWEGSAHDAKVLNDAKEKGLPMRQGNFHLADAGYALSRLTLTSVKNNIQREFENLAQASQLNQWRDSIALPMWEVYQNEVRNRGI